ITLWDDVLERMLGRPRDRALSRTVTDAVPVLAKTQLSRAITDALTDRNHRTLSPLEFPAAAGPRILQVRVVPSGGGATLLWQDVTEKTRAQQALKRSEERLALAAEGANDGLWEWDLRNQEFYVSGRWMAMLGLPGPAGIGRPEQWMDRVHADDVGALKQALDEYLA